MNKALSYLFAGFAGFTTAAGPAAMAGGDRITSILAGAGGALAAIVALRVPSPRPPSE